MDVTTAVSACVCDPWRWRDACSITSATDGQQQKQDGSCIDQQDAGIAEYTPTVQIQQNALQCQSVAAVGCL